MAEKAYNPAHVRANQATKVEQAPATTSGVFDQPLDKLPDHLALVPQLAPVIPAEAAPTNRPFPTREAWGTALLHRIFDLLSKDKMDGERIIRPAFKGLPEKRHVLVSANAPLAKRSKREEKVILTGRTAEVYPPEMSEDGKTWQIFLASQIDGDENYANLLFGQVMRLVNWDEEKGNKRKLYTKSTKDLLRKFGFIADEDVGALAVSDVSAAKEILDLSADMGPSGFVRIDVDFAKASQRIANRGARIYCADPLCACRKTKAAENKKNKTGGYYAQVSDPWIKEYLTLAGAEIDTSSKTLGGDLIGSKCMYARFNGKDHEAPDLAFAWSEYEIEQRIKVETGQASALK